jgi:hypothetical protein
MLASDPFTRQHASLLDGSYDVVDRIVLRAYFGLGGSGGGFCYWWKKLYGTLDNLDDAHLMRFAGRFSRRVRGWAKKHNVPVVYCHAGERKSQIAQEHVPTDPSFKGIFAVLVNRVPTPIWTVLRFPSGGLHLKRQERMASVYHYSFHIMDPQWGHIVIKVCGHAPFSALVMLNGHEFVACQARKAGLQFSKDGNCFTEVSDPVAFARVADSLRSQIAIGQLRRVCERWIYRCVCFGLSFDEQKRSDFRYRYSVFQVEYSRNLLFHNGHKMEQVFNGVIDRTRSALDLRQVKTIFGMHQRRLARVGGPLRCESVLEVPAFDLTVFKLHFGLLTVKLYTKGECVLRAEAITHNSKALHCGCVLERFPEIVRKLAEILDRFLSALRGVDVRWISDQRLEELPLPGTVGKTRVGGVDINKPRMRAAMEATVALSPSPDGFTVSDHARKVRELLGPAGASYSPRNAAYDLKKLRGKGLISKVPGHTRRYESTGDPLRAMAALVILRDKVIKPLLTYNGRCKPGSKTQVSLEIDARYQAIQREMQHLFKTLRIAA